MKCPTRLKYLNRAKTGYLGNRMKCPTRLKYVNRAKTGYLGNRMKCPEQRLVSLESE